LTPIPWRALALIYLAFGASSHGACAPAPAGVIAAGMTAGQERVQGRSIAAEDAVRAALRARSYPWYDPVTDGVASGRASRLDGPRRWFARISRAITKWLDRWRIGRIPGFGRGVGSLGTLVMLSVLVAFFIALVLLWRRQVGFTLVQGDGARVRLGAATRFSELPEGIRPGGGDPWAEAIARRAAGDLAGATVCLFAHQLLSLDQLGLIRLAPGRTARQYVQTVRDPDLAGPVTATLGLFEDVYYGRRRPSVLAFERVWSHALAFQERRRVLGAPV
jgi:hypothetical protein